MYLSGIPGKAQKNGQADMLSCKLLLQAYTASALNTQAIAVEAVNF